MFGWGRPRCPVTPELKLWIERRMAWLTDRFGWDYLTARPAILPNDEYFPDSYDPTARAARAMLNRLCGYMDIDADRVELRLYSDRPAPGLEAGAHAAGLYSTEGGLHIVAVEETQLLDPGVLAAILTHELAHSVLLSTQVLHGNEPDHEPLTDLFTVFQGLGALTANAFLRSANYREGNWEGWSVSRLGYLGFDAFSYALALFAWVRGERGKNWEPFLRGDVRTCFKKSVSYLDKTEDTTFSRLDALRPDWLVGYPGLTEGKHRADTHAEREPTAEGESDPFGDRTDPISFNDTFSVGILALNAGDFAEAVRYFCGVLKEAPDDEEAYLHRGEAYLGLEEYDLAMEDACKCVELDPDDVDGVFLRGRALFHLGAFNDAVADFEYLIRMEGRGSEGWWRKWRYHYWRGRLFVVNGQAQEALRAFSRAINFAPTQAEPFVHRSRLCERIVRLDVS